MAQNDCVNTVWKYTNSIEQWQVDVPMLRSMNWHRSYYFDDQIWHSNQDLDMNLRYDIALVRILVSLPNNFILKASAHIGTVDL